jgi:class 3 adenylate cyclase
MNTELDHDAPRQIAAAWEMIHHQAQYSVAQRCVARARPAWWVGTGRRVANRIEFRIGIPAGDILKDNDIFGQRVNIAPRLERSPSPAAYVSRFEM